MPEKKGRKRRHRERRRVDETRRDASEAGAGSPRRQPAQPAPHDLQPSDTTQPSDRPALRVRYAGFVLALLTMFIGILTAADAFTAGRDGVDFVFRIVAGAALIALALVIAALAVIPDRVRSLFAGR